MQTAVSLPKHIHSLVEREVVMVSHIYSDIRVIVRLSDGSAEIELNDGTSFHLSASMDHATQKLILGDLVLIDLARFEEDNRQSQIAYVLVLRRRIEVHSLHMLDTVVEFGIGGHARLRLGR